MYSIDEYQQWATSENEQSEKPWPISNALLTRDAAILSLGYSELCCPYFPVDPPPPKRISEDRLNVVWEKYSKLPRYPAPPEVNTLLVNVDEILPLFPEFDLTYVVKAGALARMSRFSEAEEILEDAMHLCSVRSALCETVGLIKSYQGDPVCFGWFMQACLLGYESFGPYLELSEAAKTIGLIELSNRLINTSDILNKFHITRLRNPKFTGAIASKEIEGLRIAFRRFLESATAFLPPADILPIGDDEQREIELILMRGWPEEEGKLRPQPLRKILDRHRFT